MHQRFTPAAQEFLSELLARALDYGMQAKPARIGLLRRFNGVYLEDCTTIALPDSCTQAYPGCGGPAGSGQAALKLYCRYELTTATITELDYFAGRVPDVVAGQLHSALPAGCLRISDLGFMHTDLLASYSQQGVWWLTRLPAGMLIGLPEQTPVELSVLLANTTQDRLDIAVRLGHAKVACRLLAWRCPDEVTQKRRNRLQATAKRKGKKVSAKTWQLAGWTVLATNASETLLRPEEAWELYRSRWQIELLFKSYKQGGLSVRGHTSKVRAMCEVLAKVLGCVVANWAKALRGGLMEGCSMAKAARIVRRAAESLLWAISKRTRLAGVLKQLTDKLARLRPDRRKRQTTGQRLLNPEMP